MDGQTNRQTGANLNAPDYPPPCPVDYVLSLSGTLSRFTSKSRIPNQEKLCVFDICTCICQALTVVAGKSEVL